MGSYIEDTEEEGEVGKEGSSGFLFSQSSATSKFSMQLVYCQTYWLAVF